MVVILPVLARGSEVAGPSCEEGSCHSLIHYNLELLRRGGTAVVPICTGRNDGEGEGVRPLFPSAQAEMTERERGYGSCSHLHKQE